MNKDKQRQSESENQPEGEGHILLNAGKTIFLIAVLVAAWFLMEWLMGRK
jgi:hypothetical protein